MSYNKPSFSKTSSSRLDAYLDDDLVPDSVSRLIFGGVSRMTYWRWQRGDVHVPDFPPAIKINNRNYRKAGQLRKFIKALMEADNKDAA